MTKPSNSNQPNSAATITIRDESNMGRAIDPLSLAKAEFQPVIPTNRAGTARIDKLLTDANEHRKFHSSANDQYLSDSVGKKLITTAHGQTSANGAREAGVALAILQRADEIAAAQKEGKIVIPTLKTHDFTAYTNLASDPRFKSSNANNQEAQSSILVKSGDTLSQLANRNERLIAVAQQAMGVGADRADAVSTLISAFATTNKVSNANQIHAGKTLTVPTEERLIAHIKDLRVAGKIDAHGNFAQNGHRVEPIVMAQSTPPTGPIQGRGERSH